MGHRIDEIDKRILYYLAQDARNTQAPPIAEEMGVTAATIRNRIRQLEEQGILRGYPADIDYQAINSHMTYQYTCTAPISEREKLVQAALEVAGVISVRELMTSKENIAITVVGSDMNDINQIAETLSDLGLEIEDESVIVSEHHRPYAPFGPEGVPRGPSLTDFMSLAGESEVVEFTVSEGAKVAGLTINEAVEKGMIDDEMLVVGIERNGDVITPKGETTFQVGDVISLFSQRKIDRDDLNVFGSQ